MLHYWYCQTSDSLLSRLLTTKQNYTQLQGQRLLKLSSVQNIWPYFGNLDLSMKKVWAVSLSIFDCALLMEAWTSLSVWNEDGHWQTKDCNWQSSKCPTIRQHSTAVPPRLTVWTLFCTMQPLGGASWLPFHPKSLHALSLCSLLFLLRMTLQFMMMHHYSEFCFKGFSSSEVIIQTNFTENFNLYRDFKHINPIPRFGHFG